MVLTWLGYKLTGSQVLNPSHLRVAPQAYEAREVAGPGPWRKLEGSGRCQGQSRDKGQKRDRSGQHWTEKTVPRPGDRSQDTHSRARQVIRSAVKKQVTGGGQRQDKHGDYSRNKKFLLLEATTGLMPGAFECLLRRERVLGGLLRPGAWH